MAFTIEHNDCIMYGYNCAKLGARMVSKMVALEYGRQNIRVNVVSPGSTETPLAASLVEEMDLIADFSLEENEASTLMGRNALPIDQANTVVFLCSDKASFITGENINVDGGMAIM